MLSCYRKKKRPGQNEKSLRDIIRHLEKVTQAEMLLKILAFAGMLMCFNYVFNILYTVALSRCSNFRLPLTALLKCELVLEKLDFPSKPVVSSITTHLIYGIML